MTHGADADSIGRPDCCSRDVEYDDDDDGGGGGDGDDGSEW